MEIIGDTEKGTFGVMEGHNLTEVNLRKSGKRRNVHNSYLERLQDIGL